MDIVCEERSSDDRTLVELEFLVLHEALLDSSADWELVGGILGSRTGERKVNG